MRKSFIALFFGILFISLQVKSQNEPLAIFLTWTEDPTTTISIDWHTAENQSQKLFFRETTSN